jgi:serine protease AprX
MNNITKITIFIAAVSVAVFALQDNQSLDTGASVGAPTMSPAYADSTTSTSSSAAAGSIHGPTLTTVDSSPQVTIVAVGAEPVATAQSAATDEPANEQERKEQIARSKMSGPVAALAAIGGPTPTEIIVSYANRPELIEDQRIEKLGGEIVRHYEILELLAIRIPADALVELAIDEKVEHVSLDEVVRTSSTVSKVVADFPVYPSGNASYDGDNVRVAILDSGVAPHTDLSRSVWQYSFLDGNFTKAVIDDGEIDREDTDPRTDYFGHGTHVAGIIAGNGYGSGGDYAGPASGADIISLQVLDENGAGQTSDVMAALEWLLKYGDDLDIRVANLSLGKPITESNTTDPLVMAVERVWDAGIVVTVAAGNFGREGYFSTTSPGNSRKVITVGSLTDNGTGDDFSDDYASTYSSKGPTAEDHVMKPDLVAPGNQIIAATPYASTLADLLPSNQVSCTNATECKTGYLELSGTSMSTAFVSSAAALMLQKDPSLTPATVKARLMRSARKMNESPIVAGAGLLDIDAAMNDNGIVSGQALSPLMTFDAATGGTLIQDTAILWGDDLWGAGYLWTDGGVTANGYLWTDGGGISANGYLWTDGGVDANGYLWTDGGVFANGYLWTDGGVAAFGYLWTDGVNASGYLWTDGGGVDSKGYIWTDGGVNALSLYDFSSATPALNDDEPTSN